MIVIPNGQGAFGETFGVPSGHTVATKPSDCSVTTRFMSASSVIGETLDGSNRLLLSRRARRKR